MSFGFGPLTDKKCSRCGEIKPIDRYGRDKTLPGARRSRCNDCRSECRRKAYADGYHVRARELQLINRHGITNEDFTALFEDQGKVCAICESDVPRAQRGWHIDHDHDGCCGPKRSCCRCRRSILCAQCNVGLGSFADSSERLRQAALYLETWKEIHELRVF